MILGGILFGIGMAILGYFPATLAVSIGEGSVDAIIELIGGLFDGPVFTIVFPFIKVILGPDLGKISAESLIGSHGLIFYLIAAARGLALIATSCYLDKPENKKTGNGSIQA